MASLIDYLKKTGQYQPQPGSLEDYLSRSSQMTPTPVQTTQPTQPVSPAGAGYTGTSVVDYLKSVGQPSDFGSRAALAGQYGIGGYAGTAEQNVQLLNALRGGVAPTSAPVAPTTPTVTPEAAAYREELAPGTTPQRELPDLSLMWEEEYQKGGWDAVKEQISDLDKQIADRKADLDKAILDESGKPISQWMITGRKKLEVDKANADINRLIEERNSMASRYNQGMEEIKQKVGLYQQAISWELGGRGVQTQVIQSGDRLVLINTATGQAIQDLGEAPAKEYSPQATPTSILEYQYGLGDPQYMEAWLSKSSAVPVGTQQVIAGKMMTWDGVQWVESQVQTPEISRASIKSFVSKWGEEEIKTALIREYGEAKVKELAKAAGYKTIFGVAKIDDYVNSPQAIEEVVKIEEKAYEGKGFTIK